MKKINASINGQEVISFVDLTSSKCPEETVNEWREKIPNPECHFLISGDPVICWSHTFCPHAHCTHAESSLHFSKKIISNTTCISHALEPLKSKFLSCFIIPNEFKSFLTLSDLLSNVKNELAETIDSILFFNNPFHADLSILFNAFPNLKVIGTGHLSIDPLLDGGELLNHTLFWKYNPKGVIIESLEFSLLKKELEERILINNFNLQYRFYISIHPVYLYPNKFKDRIDATPINVTLYITLNPNE